MAKDAYETQQLVRNNTEETVNTMKELQNWTREMKEKEKKAKMEPHSLANGRQDVPLRSDREKFGYEAAIKRSKTVGDELDESAAKQEADGYKEKGNEFAKNQQYSSAIHFYTKAIKTYDREPIFYSNNALCLLRVERYDDAIEMASKAIEMNPQMSKAFFRRAQAYEALQENAKAVEDMLKVIELEPTVSSHKVALDRLRQRLSVQSFERAAKEMEKKVWLPLTGSQKYITFINKNPNYRSKKPMKRIKVDEVLPSIPPPVTDAGEKIPDAVIDKLFNNNTGECTAELPSRHSLDFGAFYRRKQKSPPKEQDDDLDDDIPPPPSSSHQFYRTWKELSLQKRFVYLKNLSDKPLSRILGASLDSQVLSDILSVLSKFVKNNEPIDSILLELAKNEQTSILSMFFGSEDKENLRNLINYMKTNGVASATIDAIASKLNLI